MTWMFPTLSINIPTELHYWFLTRCMEIVISNMHWGWWETKSWRKCFQVQHVCKSNGLFPIKILSYSILPRIWRHLQCQRDFCLWSHARATGREMHASFIHSQNRCYLMIGKVYHSLVSLRNMFMTLWNMGNNVMFLAGPILCGIWLNIVSVGGVKLPISSSSFQKPAIAYTCSCLNDEFSLWNVA